MKVKITLILFILNLSISLSQEIGLQLWSLRNQFETDVEKSLSIINSWGIKYVEGGSTYGLSEDHFFKLLKKYDIKTVSIGASYDDLRDDIDKVIEQVKKYDVKYVTCTWIPHEGKFSINHVKQALLVFNKAGKILNEIGVTLTYHPHGYEFSSYNGLTLFDQLAINSKNFSFQMDVFWVYHGGVDPISLLDKYPGKFPLFHLKDMKIGAVGDKSGSQDVETSVTLGKGQIDIESIVKKATKQGAKYFFIEDESSLVLDQVPLSLKFLNSIN